jgi:hypothetical protein
MPDLNCELTLNKEEAANLWDLCTVLQMGCSFRDTSDLQLLKELQQWLAVTKDQPEPVTLKVTHTDAKNLWDLLAAVRAACKFSQFEGWQFVEEIHQRLQKSSSFAVARVTQTPAGSL